MFPMEFNRDAAAAMALKQIRTNEFDKFCVRYNCMVFYFGCVLCRYIGLWTIKMAALLPVSMYVHCTMWPHVHRVRW